MELHVDWAGASVVVAASGCGACHGGVGDADGGAVVGGVGLEEEEVIVTGSGMAERAAKERYPWDGVSHFFGGEPMVPPEQAAFVAGWDARPVLTREQIITVLDIGLTRTPPDEAPELADALLALGEEGH